MSINSYENHGSKYEPPSKVLVSLYAQQGMVVTSDSRCVSSQVQLPPSPADSDKMDITPPSSRASPLALEEHRLTRKIARDTPGGRSMSTVPKTPEQAQLAKKKSQYYGDAFAYRSSVSSARDRVSRDSLVLCEVQTNVILQDEFTLLTSLSNVLSTRYQRPESSIFITLKHSACFLLAGSFDPAYIMTITALPSQVQPVTNKRNASLLQASMEELLLVEPERGVVKFVSLAEESFATNGKTVAGEIEDLERSVANENSSMRIGHSLSVKSKKRAKSVRNLRPPPMDTHSEHEASSSEMDLPELPKIPGHNSLERRASKVQKLGRRKSFIAAVFGKRS